VADLDSRLKSRELEVWFVQIYSAHYTTNFTRIGGIYTTYNETHFFGFLFTGTSY